MSFDHFDKAFENRTRLQIMSVLAVNSRYDFISMKALLEVTDGNLASHIKALESAGYISVTKSFVGKKPFTQYAATRKGKEAFRKHLDALEEIIRNQKR